MTRESGKIAVIVAVIALLAAAGLGYWAYQKQKQRELHRAVAVLLKDSSTRMRDALGIEAAPPTLDRARFVKTFEGHAATADRNLQLLKLLNAKWDRALVDAADDFLLTTREILKRQAESHRHRLLLSESARELREHMGADDRTGAWVQEAVKRKERAERDYRNYRLAVSAFTKLLEQFPASQQKVARYLGPTLLIEDTALTQARRGALEIEKQVTLEIEKLRQLNPDR